MDVLAQLEILVAAVKRLLIDGSYTADSETWEKVISREDTEEARAHGILTMEIDPLGQLVCRLEHYHAGG